MSTIAPDAAAPALPAPGGPGIPALHGAAHRLFEACTLHNRTIHDSRGRAREPLLPLDRAELGVRLAYRDARALAIEAMIAGHRSRALDALNRVLEEAQVAYALAGGPNEEI